MTKALSITTERVDDIPLLMAQIEGMGIPNTSRENGSFYLTYPDNLSLDRGQFPHQDIHSSSNRNQSSLSGKGESHEN